MRVWYLGAAITASCRAIVGEAAFAISPKVNLKPAQGKLRLVARKAGSELAVISRKPCCREPIRSAPTSTPSLERAIR